MAEDGVVKQLLLQQSIPPCPNTPAGAAAWLPFFAGSSWLAYGAGGCVVIRSAPSPSAGGDNSASSSFEQVISLNKGGDVSDSDGALTSCSHPESIPEASVPNGAKLSQDDTSFSKKTGARDGNVECVAWGPQGRGMLAAVCAEAVHILAPQNGECTSPTDLPFFWRPVARLHHSSPVHAVSWTTSGDGLLSAGSEVVMWRPVIATPGAVATWQRLWTGGPRDGPQVLTATNSSLTSLVATAQGPSQKELGTGRKRRQAWGKLTETGHATVWWHNPKPADVSIGKRADVSDGQPATKKVRSQDGTGIRQSRLANGADISADVSGASADVKADVTRHHQHHRPLDDSEFDLEQELHAVVLPHPGTVSHLQWRPVGLKSSSPRRQVLLTSCEDGIVRLWLEVEIRKSRQVAGPDSQSGRGPPRFYVGAIFEPFPNVNTLPASFSGCIFWAEENAPQRGVRGAKEAQVADGAGCEWLVGVRADGLVGLWGVHCLDDSYPPRTPRVSKWDESPGLLPQPLDGSSSARWQPSVLSCAIQRPEGGQGGPPTAIELCERVSRGAFRWARIWPPVLAIGGGGGHLVAGNEPPRGGGRKSWGVAMEDLKVLGVSTKVRHVAVHPSPAVAIPATVLSDGTVWLWESSVAGVDLVAIPAVPGPFGLMGSALKASIRLESTESGASGPYSAVRWLGGCSNHRPSKQWLLALREGGIDVWEIERGLHGLKDAKLSILTSLVALEDAEGESLAEVIAVRSGSGSGSEGCDRAGMSWHVVARDVSGRSLIGWRLELRPANGFDKSAASWWVGLDGSGATGTGPLADEEETRVEVSSLKWLRFHEGEGIVGLDTENDVAPFEKVSDGKVETSGRPFEFATAHQDGSVRFWDLTDSDVEPGDATWQLVGWTQVSKRAALKCVAVAPGGGRIAVVMQNGDTSAERVQIWEGESCFGAGGSFALEGELELPASVNIFEVKWAAAHNGQLLLAVSSGHRLQVFVQGHSPRRDPESGSPDVTAQTQTGGWTCIAEAESPFERFKGLAWGRQLDLIAGAGAQLHIFGPWLTAKPSVSVLPLPPAETAPPPVNAPVSKLTYKGGSYSQLALTPSASATSLPQLGHHSSSVPSLPSLITPSSSYGSLAAADQKPATSAPATSASDDVTTLLDAAAGVAAPLADYHPRVLFHFMFEGNKRKVRACLRHLAAGLLATSAGATSAGGSGGGPVRYMHLSDLLTLDEAPEISRLPSRRTSAVGASSGKPGSENKYASLMSSAWVDEEPKPEDDVSGVTPYQFVKKDAGELFSKAEAEALSEALATSTDVQGLTSDERVQLLAIIDALAELDGGSGTPRLALDAPAERFRMATRASTLAAARKRGRAAGTADITLPSMQMAWVLHSDTKEALLDACLPDPPTWPALKALGAGFWHTNVTDLRARVEKAARAQFMENKDPKDCALLYLALDRKTVLTGLFKLSRDEKDKKLYEFLGRDFTQPQHRAAALKNSYVLMGQHRHELAAAFFLLGGSLDEAAGVCCKNLRDPQLALLVCRLREGPDGPVGRDVIMREILPSARASGDAWLSSLLLWLLGNKIEALREVAGTSADARDIAGSAPILDPEVGDYCALLAGKPGLQQGSHAKEAAEIVRRATVRAAYAYDRAGLLLQALEHLPEELNPQSSPETETPKPSETADPRPRPHTAPPSSIESGTFSWGGDFGSAGGGSEAKAPSTSANPWAFGSSTVDTSSNDVSKTERNPWAIGGASSDAETSKTQDENPWSFGGASQSAETFKPAERNPWAFGASAGDADDAETSKPSEPAPAAKPNPWAMGTSFGGSDDDVPQPPPPKPSNPWSFGGFGDSETAGTPADAPPPSKLSNPWSFGGFGDSEPAAEPADVPAPKSSNPWSFSPPEEELEEAEKAVDVTKGPGKEAQIGDGWLGVEVVAGLRSSMRHRMTSQVVCPLLQQHATWSSALTAVAEDADADSEEARLLEDLSLAVERWRVDPQRLSSTLAALAHTRSRWALFCRLVCGTSIASRGRITGSTANLAALGRAFLAAPGDCEPVTGTIVRAVVHVLPRILSVLVLSSGPSAPANHLLRPQQLLEFLRVAEEMQTLVTNASNWGGAGDSVSLEKHPLLLLNKAGVVVVLLMYLTAAWFGKRTRGLLALLRPLMANSAAPLVLPREATETQNWFEGRLEKLTSESARGTTSEGSREKAKTSGSTDVSKRDPLPPKVLVVSESDTWRVLSTCLWSQVLGALRKQLSGPKPTDAFSDRTPDSRTQGFGWNSPSQEQSPLLSPHSVSPPTSPPGGQKRPGLTPPGVGGGIAGAGGIYSRGSTSKTSEAASAGVKKARIEDEIVGALAGVQTGLRRQLAAYLRQKLDGAKSPPPLVAWLWESALKGEAPGGAHAVVPVLHLSKDPKDKEQAQQAALALLNQPKPQIPVPPLASRDPAEEELWRLVVDREKLRAALEMEGLPAPNPGLFKSDVTAAAAPKVAPLKDSPFVNKTKGLRQPEAPQQETVLGYGDPEEVFTLPGELLEAVCVNALDPRQMVVATNRKGLVYADVRPGSGSPGATSAPASFAPMGDTLWGKSFWPSRGWPGTSAKTEPPPASSTPPTSAHVGSYVSGMSVQGGVAGLGAGAGTWALGWDVDEGSAEDPVPLLESVTSRTLAAHPLRPFFLVGSNNTHTYLWEFGREKASATYGVLPAVSGPPPYVIPSVERVRWDRYGHRFATAANDGTVSTWRLEVGGRSQTRADETRQCFSRHASDLAFVGASGSVIAAAGLSPTNENIVLWDTLAPPTSSRAAVFCHDGGARCLAVIDSAAVGGYPLIVSGGRAGDLIVHDFRYVASGRGVNKQSGQNGNTPGGASGSPGGSVSRKPPVGEAGGSTSDRTVWSIPRAHPGGVHTIESVPGTSLFVTGGKDGEVKLWDAATSRLVRTWEKAHDKRTFLNARGGGAVMQAAVTLVLPVQDGMLSCGADGIVKRYPQQEIAFAKS